MAAKTKNSENDSAIARFCSKCGVHPRADPDGTNPWCLECRAEYQATYWKGREARAQERGYAEGLAAMRAAAVHRFQQFPSAYFSGAEIAASLERLEIKTT